jgi:thiamine biosynthesis lipoprotein
MNAEYSGHRDILEYQHAAMATMFSVMIAGEDSAFAEQAAMAAFQEIDRLEQELSRYIPTSDISRINNLMPHGCACIGLDAFQCLQIASQCWTETGGAFDITVGALKDCWIGKDRSLLHPPPEEVRRARSRTGMGLLALRELTYGSPRRRTVSLCRSRCDRLRDMLSTGRVNCCGNRVGQRWSTVEEVLCSHSGILLKALDGRSH